MTSRRAAADGHYDLDAFCSKMLEEIAEGRHDTRTQGEGGDALTEQGAPAGQA